MNATNRWKFLNSAIGFILILIPNLSLGQTRQMDTSDSTNFFRTVPFKIGGITTGINYARMGLSEVVLANNTAFLAERTRKGYYLMATSDFQPSEGQLEFIRDVRVAILFLPIMNEGYDPAQLDKVYPLPNWISFADQMDYLQLNQVSSNSINLIRTKRLNFLVLNKIQIEDRGRFLHELTQMMGLKNLVHDSLFTPSEVLELKESIPGLTVLSLTEYEAGLASGKFKNP
jgi:hypothetical protein